MKDQVVRFLKQASTLTLATASPDGEPFAADLYFVSNNDLELYFISEPDTRHAANIQKNKLVAATIHTATWDWRDIKGLQIRGSCFKVTGAGKRMAALKLYGQKFQFMPAFSTLITRHCIFRIIPGWFRWLDNSINFGYKQESVPPSG